MGACALAFNFDSSEKISIDGNWQVSSGLSCKKEQKDFENNSRIVESGWEAVFQVQLGAQHPRTLCSAGCSASLGAFEPVCANTKSSQQSVISEDIKPHCEETILNFRSDDRNISILKIPFEMVKPEQLFLKQLKQICVPFLHRPLGDLPPKCCTRTTHLVFPHGQEKKTARQTNCARLSNLSRGSR